MVSRTRRNNTMA